MVRENPPQKIRGGLGSLLLSNYVAILTIPRWIFLWPSYLSGTVFLIELSCNTLEPRKISAGWKNHSCSRKHFQGSADKVLHLRHP